MRNHCTLFVFVLAAAGGGQLLAQQASSKDIDSLINDGNLALVQTRYAEAERIFSDALAQQPVPAPQDLQTARILYGLSAARKTEGRCDESSEMASRSIRILETVPGLDAGSMSNAWKLLGSAYHCQHMEPSAVYAFKKSLEFTESITPPETGRICELLASIGAAYTKEGHYKEAEAAFERANSVARKLPPDDPAFGALLLNNWATERRMNGKGRQAEQLLNDALSALESAPKRENALIAAVTSNLAMISLDRKDYARAAELFGKAVKLIDDGAQLLPADAHAILTSYAECLRKSGNKAEARTFETRAKVAFGALPAQLTEGLLVHAGQSVRDR